MSKQFLYAVGCLTVLTLLLSACQPSPADARMEEASTTPNAAPATPTATPQVPAITLYYTGQTAQVELTSPQGIRVLVDVTYPSLLSSPPTDKDILLTSHHHADHYYASFVRAFPGQQLFIEEGEIVSGDVTIHSILTEHALTDFGAASACDNAVFIIDIGGLRVVHFGDFGQQHLTPELAAALGDVDVAIILLGDARLFTQILKEKTMFTFLSELKPKLVIPTTHSDMESVGYATQLWQGYYSSENPVTISAADLNENTQVLVLGVLASSYQKLFNLPTWSGLPGGR